MKPDKLEIDFEVWLRNPETLEMAGDVAYAHGDIVSYERIVRGSELWQILWAAFNAGALSAVI